MAKKPKRRSSFSANPQQSENQSASPRISSRSFSNEFNPDYKYVKDDLKRIGILAGSFFVVLIALSFIL